MANIGRSIAIQGQLTGNEDLSIEGQVEGRIELPNNELTIGAEGRVVAEIHAQSVIVVGRVRGDITATERVQIQANGEVEGDVTAPRIAVEEGAVLHGALRMDTKRAESSRTYALSGSEPPRARAAAGGGAAAD